jgi:hypothetical protein
MCPVKPPRRISRTSRREILDWNNRVCQFIHVFNP